MAARRLTYTEFLDTSPMTAFLWILLIGVSMAQILDGFEIQSTTFALPQVIEEFHITPVQAGAIPSATNLGLLAGALLFGVLADRFGRQRMFQGIIATYAFGSLLSAIAPSYEFLLLARVIAGFGIGAEFPVAYALLSEFAPTRYRHLFIACGPFTNAMGYVVTAGLAIWLVPTFGWRSLYWLGICPVFVILYFRQLVPESVRFLLSRNRVEEAGRITRQLADRAGFGPDELELVPPEQVSRRLLTAADKRALYRASLPAFGALLLLYFCQYIQVTGIQQWEPTIFVRQGFTLASSFQFTFVILLGTMLSHPLAGWMQERMKRKYALMVESLVGGLFFVSSGFSFALGAPIAVTIGALFLSTLFAQGMITILFTLGSELFPTPIRSLSMAIVSGAGRVGSIIGPLLVGVLLASGAAISQVIFVFSIPLVLASLVAVLLLRVDTRQKSLEAIQQTEQAAVSC